MSLWSKFTGFVAKVFGVEQSSPTVSPTVSPPPRLRSPGATTPKRQPGPTVTRGSLRHQRYNAVWQKVYEDFDRSLPSTAIEEFNEREAHFRAQFDVWSDPSESEDLKTAAYEQFWDDMADFGYSIADFDWSDFKQKYESLGG